LDIKDVEECQQLSLLRWWSSLIQDVDVTHVDFLELRIPKEPRRLSPVVVNETFDFTWPGSTCCFLDERLAEATEESIKALVEFEAFRSCCLLEN
jgi:3',5'-cyclic AMP phosphodiesterase CpdA